MATTLLVRKDRLAETRLHSAPDAPLADWVAYVHERENAHGPHRELWQHQSGCRAWLVVERDTRSHAVLGVTALRPEPVA